MPSAFAKQSIETYSPKSVMKKLKIEDYGYFQQKIDACYFNHKKIKTSVIVDLIYEE